MKKIAAILLAVAMMSSVMVEAFAEECNCERTEIAIEENRKLLKKLGKVIYLSVKPDTVYDRLKDDDTRPLLRGDANTVKEKINSM